MCLWKRKDYSVTVTARDGKNGSNSIEVIILEEIKGGGKGARFEVPIPAPTGLKQIEVPKPHSSL